MPVNFQCSQGRHVGQDKWAGSFPWPGAQRQLGRLQENRVLLRVAPKMSRAARLLDRLDLVRTVDVIYANSPIFHKTNRSSGLA